MYFLPAKPEADTHQDRVDDKEDDGRGKCAAIMQVLHTLLIDIIGQNVGGVFRSALRHQCNGIEADGRRGHGGNQHVQDRGRDEGQSNLEEGFHFACTIQGSRLVNVTGHTAQTGNDIQHAVSKAGPNADDNDREHRGVGALIPAKRLSTKPLQHNIENTGGGIHQPHKHNGNTGRSDDGRREDHRLHQRVLRGGLIEENAKQEFQGKTDKHGGDHENRRILHHQQKILVMEQIGIVIKGDKFLRSFEDVPLEKTHVDGENQRDDLYDDTGDHRRSDQHIGAHQHFVAESAELTALFRLQRLSQPGTIFFKVVAVSRHCSIPHTRRLCFRSWFCFRPDRNRTDPASQHTAPPVHPRLCARRSGR